MFNKKIVFVFLILPLLFIGCVEDPSPIGAQLLDQDLIEVEELNSQTDSITQSSSSYKKVIQLGAANNILIGKAENVEASTLVRFLFNLPDSVIADIKNNNINILESSVELTRTYAFGDTNSSFNFSAHKILSNWTSGGFTADSLSSLNFEAAEVSSNKDLNDSLLVFDLDNLLVDSWFKAKADTSDKSDRGIIIKPSSPTGQVIGFQALSSTAVNVPRLKVVFEKPGAYKDTISFIATADVSVVSGSLPNVGAENIVVQSSLAAYSKLYFDLSKLPADAVINSAELTLSIDTLQSKTGSNFINSILVFNIVDSTSKDSITSESIQLVRSGNKFQAKITAFVNSWINKENLGMLIKTGDEFSGLEIFALKGSSASDSAMRPKLTVTYTKRK